MRVIQKTYNFWVRAYIDKNLWTYICWKFKEIIVKHYITFYLLCIGFLSSQFLKEIRCFRNFNRRSFRKYIKLFVKLWSCFKHKVPLRKMKLKESSIQKDVTEKIPLQILVSIVSSQQQIVYFKGAKSLFTNKLPLHSFCCTVFVYNETDPRLFLADKLPQNPSKKYLGTF